jgi:hypothetical protein
MQTVRPDPMPRTAGVGLRLARRAPRQPRRIHNAVFGDRGEYNFSAVK